MVTPRIQIAPERIAEGKRLYDLTLTRVADIATMMGISRRTLVRRMHEWGWTPRSAPRHATDRMLVAAAPSGAANAAMAIAVPLPAEARAAVAARIHGVVAQSLDAVERVLALAGPADEVAAERSSSASPLAASLIFSPAAFACSAACPAASRAAPRRRVPPSSFSFRSAISISPMSPSTAARERALLREPAMKNVGFQSPVPCPPETVAAGDNWRG